MAPAEPFVALVFYPTTPPVQTGQADTLLRMAEAEIRAMPGFVGARMFLAEDGESVVTLIEWQSRQAFLDFRQSEFGRAATVAVGDLHPRAHYLLPYATVMP